MTTTRGAGITAAAGTGLAHPLFSEIFTLDKSRPWAGTQDALITLARIVKVS